ncbi:inorganic phosphate cotransporter isoform X1 [Olea europaea subsp. europaea]|uniref:Inorganic phosphate cotransporter isoform X1 n=1 Tax=Olea europaea subsp. europaea TaxID=158383 RepID=A0A8S0Q7E7_OLEEU|nr:inorganic phosphate cotransporter isoform X1 [Olea europaea subsp. europaea]
MGKRLMVQSKVSADSNNSYTILFHMTTDYSSHNLGGISKIIINTAEQDTNVTAGTTAPKFTPEQLSTVDDEASQEDKFMWSPKEQSMVKGGFYYSYFLFMVLGGRISELYGAKYVLLLGVAGSAIINLATPWIARYNLGLLVASQVLMGALQSSVVPSMYPLMNRWLTLNEASSYAPMLRMSIQLGQMVVSIVFGLIPRWPNVFYVVGGIGCIWSIIWLVVATSDPSSNRWVSEQELAHILRDKKREEDVSDKSKIKIPWLRIITSPSVIGFILVKTLYNLWNYFIAVELPSYLKHVHHTSEQTVAVLFFVGWFAKYMVEKKPFGLSKTYTRKFFESIGTFGSEGLLLLLIPSGHNLTYITVDLLLMGLVSMFVAGGDSVLAYDLSEEYSTTIVAIATCVANTSGFIVPTITGFMLGSEGGSQTRWNYVIALIAVADILGGLLFCLLVKAKPINFEQHEEEKFESTKVIVY